MVVCESDNQWAVAFRRLLGQKARVFETRMLCECREQLSRRPYGVAAVQWSPQFKDALPEWIWQTKRSQPECRILVLGVSSVEPGYWAALEAGADCVTPTIRDLAASKLWILRHFTAAPLRTFETIREEVAAGLPWAGFETSGKFRVEGE